MAGDAESIRTIVSVRVQMPNRRCQGKKDSAVNYVRNTDEFINKTENVRVDEVRHVE